jgi:hypothetical protein
MPVISGQHPGKQREERLGYSPQRQSLIQQISGSIVSLNSFPKYTTRNATTLVAITVKNFHPNYPTFG